MSREEGLKRKYYVKRIDGKSIENCIVLEFTDKNGREGIKAFSKAVREDGYILLANDLEDLLKYYQTREVSE